VQFSAALPRRIFDVGWLRDRRSRPMLKSSQRAMIAARAYVAQSEDQNSVGLSPLIQSPTRNSGAIFGAGISSSVAAHRRSPQQAGSGRDGFA
jgi:hypothetical protein